MQAQLARAPFVGLWTRLEKMKREDLVRALDDKRVVRATFNRGTLHMVSTNDYVALRATIQLALDHGMRAILKERLKDGDAKKVVEVARKFFETPKTMDELRDSGLFEGDIRAKTYAARCLVPLVQLHDGSSRFVLAEKYLKKKIPTTVNEEELVRRYLAAYGPATIADAQVWSGIPDLKDAFTKLDLVTFGKYFDLPKAPRPDEDAPAPPRFLPEFDSVLLAHKDRRRVIADEHRKAVYLPALRVAATILVDGAVAGSWIVKKEKKSATLVVTPFAKLAKAAKDALAEEGAALVRFVEPDAGS
ncbi:MAG TPA: winged helix DNA-binding domain-containing protein, partial [Polyangiaceae bacterium]